VRTYISLVCKKKKHLHDHITALTRYTWAHAIRINLPHYSSRCIRPHESAFMLYQVTRERVHVVSGHTRARSCCIRSHKSAFMLYQVTRERVHVVSGHTRARSCWYQVTRERVHVVSGHTRACSCCIRPHESAFMLYQTTRERVHVVSGHMRACSCCIRPHESAFICMCVSSACFYDFLFFILFLSFCFYHCLVKPAKTYLHLYV
jgi:hypothetical protein